MYRWESDKLDPFDGRRKQNEKPLKALHGFERGFDTHSLNKGGAMSETIWKIVEKLEQVVEWVKATTPGKIAAAVAIVALGVIVALISSEPAFGCWTVALLVVGLGLLVVLRQK